MIFKKVSAHMGQSRDKLIEGWDQYYIWIISLIVTFFLYFIYYELTRQNSIKEVIEVTLWSGGIVIPMPIVWSRWFDLLLSPIYSCLFVYLFKGLIKKAAISCIIGSILGVVLGLYFSLHFSLLNSVLNCIYIAIAMPLSMLFGLKPKFALAFSICMLTLAIFAIGMFNGLVVGFVFSLFYSAAALIKSKIEKLPDQKEV